MIRLMLSALGCLAAGAAPAADDGPIRPREICRAAIAAVMDRDPSIMRVRRDGGIIHVEYVLREGGAVWGYRCRLEGSKIMWASAKGRWNIHPEDLTVTFEVPEGGGQVMIVERAPDGTSSVTIFPRSKLQ